MKRESEKLIHPIAPVFAKTSGILILGSFPSVLSRRSEFYYGNPQNRFWQVLSTIYERPLPKTNEEKREFILSCRLALWDVVASCRVSGSADSSITEVVPNDLSVILSRAPIRKILLNGKTAERWFRKYHGELAIPALVLPSTSPANAAWSLERLTRAWREGLLN